MPFGLLLDLWECYLQEKGVNKAQRDIYIEDVIPDGV